VISIERIEAPSDEIRLLIGELDAELSANYPPEQRHGLVLDAIFQPHIRFFLARLDGEAVGCGGVALFEGFGEAKRMYVRPSTRGFGVADAIVAELEAATRSAGLGLLRLETGTEQAAALRFYQRNGFQPCEPFEPYASMPPHKISTSVFLEKHLSGTPSSFLRSENEEGAGGGEAIELQSVKAYK